MPRRFEGLSKTSDESTLLPKRSEKSTNLTQLRAVHHRFRDPQAGSHEMLRLRGGAGDSWKSFLDEAQQAIDEVSPYQRQQDYIKYKMGDGTDNDRYTLYLSYRNKRDRSTEAIKANNERQKHGKLFKRIQNSKGEDKLLETIAKYLSHRSTNQKADRGKGSNTQPYEQQEVAASSDSGDSDSQQQDEQSYHGEGSSTQPYEQQEVAAASWYNTPLDEHDARISPANANRWQKYWQLNDPARNAYRDPIDTLSATTKSVDRELRKLKARYNNWE